MSRRRGGPGRLEGMSGAGLLVVGSLCLAFLIVVVTVCVLAVLDPASETPAALDRLLQALVVAVPALLAKTYRDLKASSDGPTTVTADPAATVTVEPAVDEQLEPAVDEQLADELLEPDEPRRRRR